MKKISLNIIIVSILFSLLFYFSCKTKPDVKPSTTTVSSTTTTSTTTTTTTIEEVTTTTTTTTTIMVDKISEDEIRDAEEWVDKAQKVGAEKYDPDNFNKAKDLLEDGKNKKDVDPTSGRESLSQSKEYAKLAYENSLKMSEKLGLKNKVINKKSDLDKLFAEAESISADKIYPDDYNKAKTYYSEADEKFNQEEYQDAYNKYSDSETILKDIIAKTKLTKREFEDKIGYVKKLIGEADKLGAKEFAKDDFDNANTKLEDGVSKYDSLDFSSAKIAIDEAESFALSSIEKTKFGLKEKKRLEALKAIMEAGRIIEDASNQPTLNEKGEPAEKDIYKLNLDDLDKNLSPSPDDEELTNFTYKDLLAKAIEYIEKAKQSYKNQDYEQAILYARLAKKIAESYKGTGVKTTYKVRLIPERRDCLWRIAEYDFIYNNAFLWPRIWKTNKKAILNPDLIFPDQVFLIPEID
ncbi:MAG: hypothetical protein A2086_16825 [Spirochaetes bacterium GWD1_27_9]|nr:MAG: hypothetical protein A2Z98_02305 [Spirochaetes bacterium GWB1_27_13]OHD23315.1 MAG: hypothetical protein A2Y34_11625 [Spirochaetes bacterium GWC1_27_15]OHD32309.1 MAG: hypothetical protein A2086_16825 [Spirochaetes bacterium GWD1_27_9]